MQNITLNTSSVQNNSNESGISDNGLYPEANSLNGSTNENLAFTNKSNTFIPIQTFNNPLWVSQNNNYFNIGIGQYSLSVNTGTNNIAIGSQTLQANTTGNSNIAIGVISGASIINGNDNVSIGLESLANNISGDNNISIGSSSNQFLYSGNNNVSIGNSSGLSYTGSESNNILIGTNVTGILGESNMLRIGNKIISNLNSLKGLGFASICGIDNRIGITVPDTSAITLYTSTAAGQLYRVSSRILATVGSSAEYAIGWFEGGTGRNITLSVSSVNNEVYGTFIIQPDNNSTITVGITSVTSSTINVATTIEQLV